MAPVKPINTRSTSTRKKISKVRFLNNLYSSPTSKNVKKYLEHHLAEVAEKQNLTDQGAETVTLKGGGHAGGWDPNEPFHFTVSVEKANGDPIKTVDPRTNRDTPTHHFYIPNVTNKQDLESSAAAWIASLSSAASGSGAGASGTPSSSTPAATNTAGTPTAPTATGSHTTATATTGSHTTTTATTGTHTTATTTTGTTGTAGTGTGTGTGTGSGQAPKK